MEILRKKKGFTLIELIVVMAVIGFLVLLAAPRFVGQTKKAQFTKHINNAKVLEDASERYYIDHGKWPRGADEDVYSAEQVDAYAERIFDITGKEIVLEEGNYWDIDYSALSSYAKLPDESERANYVLRNPVGKVYYLEGLTEEGVERLPELSGGFEESEKEPKEFVYSDWIEGLEEKGYTLVTDTDFKKITNQYAPKGYYWSYIGTKSNIIIPLEIQGEMLTDYYRMFGLGSSPSVKAVASKNWNVTNMAQMFYKSPSVELNLSELDTSSVVNMRSMFHDSQATTINLIDFDTSNVTDMNYMFALTKAPILDLGSFDTSKVTDMTGMFNTSKVTNLNLNSFDTSQVLNMSYMFRESLIPKLDLRVLDTSKVVDMTHMFYDSKSSVLDLSSFDISQVKKVSDMFSASKATIGYGRTQEDANFLNSVSYKPSTLTFTVKP